MFCSKCGKTLKPDQDNCPHCGAPVGESRFEGHTSAQPRYQAQGEQGEAKPRYAPYTRTSYTSMDGDGEDLYSRTTYRPVLSDTDAQKHTGMNPEPGDEAEELPEAEDNRDERAEKTAAAPEDEAQNSAPAVSKPPVDPAQEAVQSKDLEALMAAPEDAPDASEAKKIIESDLGIVVEPPKPIRKTGISPEVEGYIQRMEAMKSKASRRKKPRDEEEEEEEESASTAGAQIAEEEAEDEEEAPVREKKKKKAKAARAVKEKKPRGKAGKWIVRILSAVAIVVLIAGGIYYLAQVTQERAPIAGVSLDLYDQGIALIKGRSSDTYRSEIVKLFSSDQSGASAVARQAADSEEIQKLLPEKPEENDQLFIDTLLTIQGAVNTATTTDALALLTSGDSSLGALSEESKQQWDIIQNYITRLVNTNSASELSAISKGVDVVNATPAPSPTPAPESGYSTLKKGDKNNSSVKELQNRLYQLGYFNGKRDGDYGGITQTAVKRFQQEAGMTVDGIATAEVQEAIFAENAPRIGDKVTPAPDLDQGLTSAITQTPAPTDAAA